MSSTKNIDLSIIIVTWNAMRFTQECLDSLQSYMGDPSVEIIVVDNASSDGTPEMIEKAFPRVKLMRNEANLGFAKANNIGIAASTGNYVCLVNSDVRVLGDCLASMRAYMEEDPSVGVIGPQMLAPNGTIARSYMRFPTLWRTFCNALGLHRISRRFGAFSGIQMTEFDNSRTSEVDVLNGWFLMVRRVALEDVGLLDPRFFMYGEDIDWSYRFYKAGWKRVYFAGARSFHHGAASSAAAPTRFYVEMKRANLQLYKKHYGTLGYLGYMLLTCLHEGIRVAAYGPLRLIAGPKRAEMTWKTERSIASIRSLNLFGIFAGDDNGRHRS